MASCKTSNIQLVKMRLNQIRNIDDKYVILGIFAWVYFWQ